MKQTNNIFDTGVDDGVWRTAAVLWRRPMRQNDIRRRVNDALKIDIP